MMLKVLFLAAIVAAASADFRVINGQRASQGQFPFAVYLYGCSGSLISPNTVLTAAHCERGIPNRVLIGALSSRGGGQTANIVRKIRHPRYRNIGGDDLLVLKLDRRVNAPTVQLECNPVRLGTAITVAGYGLTRVQGGTSGTLMWATNRSSNCPWGFPAGSICQGVNPNTPFKGDSGGPLMIGGPGSYRQVGVVSGGDPNRFAVYGTLGINNNCNWVKQYMN